MSDASRGLAGGDQLAQSTLGANPKFCRNRKPKVVLHLPFPARIDSQVAMVRLALRRLALTVLIATFLTGELAFAADGDAAPAKPAPKPAAKAAPAKSPAAKTTPAPAKAPPAKAAVPPVVPDSPSSSDSSGLSSSSEKEEYSSDDSEYFDYQYSGSSDYAAFEDENYFDWFAEDESEWTSSSVPRGEPRHRRPSSRRFRAGLTQPLYLRRGLLV